MRDPAGKAVPIEGDPVRLPFLPEWDFFIRRERGEWILTEVKTGAMFPPVVAAVDQTKALELFDRFAQKQGYDECMRVFHFVLEKFGDLTRPQ